MRILLVHPGSPFSTGDVYSGLLKGLRHAGHDVHEYRLDLRIEEAHDFQGYRQRRNRKADKAIPRAPIMREVVRIASMPLLEAVLTVLPHWVVVVSGMVLYPDTMVMMNRMGANTALVLTESPYDDDKQARMTPFFQVVTTHERGSVGLMRRWWRQSEGKLGSDQIHYLPHAYDPEIHHPGARLEPKLDDQVKAHDVVFVGSGFQERIEMLEGVDWKELDCDFGLYGHWPYVSKRSPLRPYLRDNIVPNTVTAALYAKAKIGLNLYRQSAGTSRNALRVAGAESLNPRALELAAIGVPHVSDWRPEVTEVFGETVPTFTKPAQLQELLRNALANYSAEWRDLHGKILQRSVKDWTFDKRAEQLGGILAAHPRSAAF